MTGINRHRASIRWSPDHLQIGLPSFARSIDPAWVFPSQPVQDEGWSLVYEFDRSPAEQGNPSIANVHFLVADAPHDQLVAGAVLHLVERATRRYARVTILD